MPVQPSITVSRDPSVAAAALATANGGGKVGGSPMPDPEHDSRKAMREAARREHASGRTASLADTAGGPGAEDVVVREDVESVEMQLSDGRKLWVGPPDGVSLKMRMMTGFGHLSISPTFETRIMALMSVRSIDGNPVSPVVTMLDAQKLANELGDRVLDIVVEAYLQNWPPPRMADLQVIQKKMRKN